MQSSYRNNKFKALFPIWDDKLPDGSYSVSDTQDYFEYIIKKHETFYDNPPIKMYLNKTESKITSRLNKIKTGYYLELLTHEY